MNPVKNNLGLPKYKIYEKGDLEEKPVFHNGKKMIFRTKFAMKELFTILNKDPTMEYEWSEI